MKIKVELLFRMIMMLIRIK